MIPDSTQRCFAVGLGWFGLALYTASVGAGEPDGRTGPRSVKMALVQFDSVPEKTEQNLDEMEVNEWARYDTGTGPERFQVDGIVATCFICADGAAPRCIERARLVKPQVVFYPNNRAGLPDFPVFGAYAAKIGAPMLVTNRVGKSWDYDCKGGCVIFGASGDVLAKANRSGEEEVLYYTLSFPATDDTQP